jgi:aspartyl-tRNA(Asn)/glutamyl-tRNA(Gln) amidotransferase subunit C
MFKPVRADPFQASAVADVLAVRATGMEPELRAERPLCYTARVSSACLLGQLMSVDAQTVRRIAHLARIAVADDEVEHLQGELNAILAFVEQLSEVDVASVEPMTSVTPIEMKKREDVVTDGGIADAVLQNAPAREDHYFVVPKVVE